MASLTRAAMLTSRKKTGVVNVLMQLALVGLLATTLSFTPRPTSFSPYASGLPVSLDLPDNDRIERFMRSASDSALTILNGNLWMLPNGLSVDREKRLDQFVAYARRLQPHVITLQEIWTTDLVEHLKKSLPEFQVYASGGSGVFNKAGLVTLTRIPADSAGFLPFALAPDASLVEQHAQKGYLTVRLNTPTFTACIINTHLYAPTQNHERAITRQQFETLKALDLRGDYFIVGDLNLPQQAFERLNVSTFLTEADTTHTVDPSNRYRHSGVNSNAVKQAESYKVDRLLMPQTYADRFALNSMLIRKPVLSDHYLLAYRIELR